MLAYVKIKIILLAAILMTTSTPASAGYLDFISTDRLPKEALPALSQLREIEPSVMEWHRDWESSQLKEELRNRITGIYQQMSQLQEKDRNNSDLLLLMGLLGFYGYNLDLDGYGGHAEEHLSQAMQLKKDDYRPYWFLGNHLSKSTRVIEGMKKFLDAEKKFTVNEPMFWEDYAQAAYLSAMKKHVLFALDKYKKITGKESRLEAVVGKTAREHLLVPNPEDKMYSKLLWDPVHLDSVTTFQSTPFGCRLTIPKKLEQNCLFYNFTNRSALVHIKLSPMTGKKSERYYPNFIFMPYVPRENESLDDFTKKFMDKKLSWKKYSEGLNLGETCYLGEIPASSKKEKEIKLVLITFERKNPELSGLMLEEPSDDYGNGGGVYRLADTYDRFKGRIFFLVMLETTKSFFGESEREFKGILNSLVVE